MEGTYTYSDFLISILDKKSEKLPDTYKKELKLNLYLTLLSLSNNNYQESYYENNFNIIDDFLRKINNLKIKIQLKRKISEIDKLLTEITAIYNDNTKLIDKYNEEKLDIISTLNEKNAKEITKIVDTLTKAKFKQHDFHTNNINLRKEVSDSILNCNVTVEDETINIHNPNKEIKIQLSDFFLLFDYLLDINLYENIFTNELSNKQHKKMIENIISIIETDTIPEDSSIKFVPMVLTYFLTKNNNKFTNTDTSSFSIENIKITDLYSFANNKNNTNENTAKWEKISIPNAYLFDKLIKCIKKGMYYNTEEKYIFENISDNKTSDFKVSISNDKIIVFLKNSILENKTLTNF